MRSAVPEERRGATEPRAVATIFPPRINELSHRHPPRRISIQKPGGRKGAYAAVGVFASEGESKATII